MTSEPKIRKNPRPPVIFRSPTPEQVKRAREIVGISLSQAGAAAGVTGRQWTNFENGSQAMNGRTWINWCFRYDLVKPDL